MAGGGHGGIQPPAVRPMIPATAVGQQATPPAAQLLPPAAGQEAARVACPVQAPLETPGHAADSVEPMQQPMQQTPVTAITTAAGIQQPGPPTFVFGAMGGGSLTHRGHDCCLACSRCLRGPARLDNLEIQSPARLENLEAQSHARLENLAASLEEGPPGPALLDHLETQGPARLANHEADMSANCIVNCIASHALADCIVGWIVQSGSSVAVADAGKKHNDDPGIGGGFPQRSGLRGCGRCP